jgi:hypothetical protein
MLKQHNLVKVLPQMLHNKRSTIDCITVSVVRMCDLYNVICKPMFLINIRTVVYKEVANNRELLVRLLHFYEMINRAHMLRTRSTQWPLPRSVTLIQ